MKLFDNNRIFLFTLFVFLLSWTFITSDYIDNPLIRKTFGTLIIASITLLLGVGVAKTFKWAISIYKGYFFLNSYKNPKFVSIAVDLD